MTVGKIKHLAFAEGTTVTPATDLATIAAGLVPYATEAAFVTAEGTAAVGDAFYDTTLNVVKYYDGAWKTLITTANGLANPMDGTGQLIYGGASGTATKLSAGTTSQVLIGSPTTPNWGSVTNAMIDAAAGITYSKLTLTGAILNGDLAGSIADTKLATISTAGKVSGSAITSGTIGGSTAISTSGTLATGAATITGNASVSGLFRLARGTDINVAGSSNIGAGSFGTAGHYAMITAAGVFNLISMPAASDGALMVVINKAGSGKIMTVDYENTGETSANRIFTNTGSDKTFSFETIALFMYSTSIGRWMLIN